MVIPAIDHIDEHLATATLSADYPKAIKVALTNWEEDFKLLLQQNWPLRNFLNHYEYNFSVYYFQPLSDLYFI